MKITIVQKLRTCWMWWIFAIDAVQQYVCFSLLLKYMMITT